MSKQYTVKVLVNGIVVKTTAPTTYATAFHAVCRLQPRYPRNATIVLYEADRVMDSFSGMKGV